MGSQSSATAFVVSANDRRTPSVQICATRGYMRGRPSSDVLAICLRARAFILFPACFSSYLCRSAGTGAYCQNRAPPAEGAYGCNARTGRLMRHALLKPGVIGVTMQWIGGRPHPV